ncbi:PAS domain S-box protein [Flavobacterium sp.]|uniref:PAS domain S-box protein n=1 Tax=Flavobacterium sp. TaxID=239 RepID=UPI0024874236|nr:PAS domain S-box protein [Flavobacterium sp.]MDI1317739.1 PAS domain S-box protein [Flavobacterium sp.]
MKDFQFQFDASSFNKLFPFYILIDADLNIKKYGESLSKLIPSLNENTKFIEVFSIKRPFVSLLAATDFIELVDQLITIEALHQNQIILRGQFQKHNGYFLFVGSPWFVSMEEVTNNKLKLNDFATHDPLIDLLHVLKAQELTSQDLKELIDKINEQQKALTKDKEEIKQLSLVASANKSGVILTDLDGKIFWSNEAYLELTGYSRCDVIDKTIVNLGVSELSDHAVLKSMITAFKFGENFDCEIYHKKKNNDWFWARTKGQPVLDTQGKVVQYFVIIDDITKEKEINDKLKESESRLTSLILNLQTGILLEDENRKILLVNKEFCSMFGINAEPNFMIGMDCTNSAEESKGYFHNSEQFVPRINEILSNKEIVLGEELRLIDGRVLERRYIPITSDGIYKGHLWSYTDITLNKKYNEGLRHEKEKYRSIIDNMNIGLVEVALDKTVLLVNNRFSEMIGYPVDFLIGKNASDLSLDSASKEKLETKLANRKLGLSDSYELSVTNKNGELKQWLISGAPNYNLNGEVIGSIGMHFDITETNNLEIQKEKLLKRLEKQNEQLNEYAHMVSHDLKSPLRSIHTLITFIREDNEVTFNNKTRKYFTLIQEKAEKMDRLIQGILTYSKIETVEGSKEKFNLNELVNHILSILFIPSNVKVIIDKKLPVIVADRFRIQQLFQNLLSNAISYNEKTNGIVAISFEEFNDYFVFSIQDNGIGIPEKNQKKIFQMFQSSNTNETASGIGLSIVKRIIDNLNEKIWLESEENVGTKFFFTIHK